MSVCIDNFQAARSSSANEGAFKVWGWYLYIWHFWHVTLLTTSCCFGARLLTAIKFMYLIQSLHQQILDIKHDIGAAITQSLLSGEQTATWTKSIIFAHDIIECILLNKTGYNSIKRSLKAVPMGRFDDQSTLAQVLTWCHSGNTPLP